MRGRGRAANSPERQYFFSTFYPESGDAGSDVWAAGSAAFALWDFLTSER